ncbi:DUF736 family protein [Sphingomonas sp. SUN019]|uniref:DUF736 domain-containing protein n=1 Tax=Sphingomonas sp. SUN019 TaxID=2937788 RepID=UPI002164C44D|nr:DUF736 family protein [Sphingomonas sp. SUN019]UVO50913.1 DUF736 family protein [Sphingomonas sp. SUN019]
MSAIGYLTKHDDGSFKGWLKTLSIRADIDIDIDIVANRSEASDVQPDYRVLADGVETGAGLTRRSEPSGRDYVSLSFAVLKFGRRRLHANLGRATGEAEDRFAKSGTPPIERKARLRHSPDVMTGHSFC